MRVQFLLLPPKDDMRGTRLLSANKVAKRTFFYYHRFTPQNIHHWDRGWTEQDIKRFLGYYRKTKVPCSCWMCGHRRKWDGLPIKEIKQLLKFKEELLNIDMVQVW